MTNFNDEIIYYVDMDGFIAKWDQVSSIEDTAVPGYFCEREPEEEAIRLVKMLRDSGRNVSILSAVYSDGHSDKDKLTWIKAQGLDDIPYVFVPYGESKDKYIDNTKKLCVLIDDFSENLHRWEHAGHIGIKFYNQFNGHHGTWCGYSINDRMSARSMYNAVTGIVEKEFESMSC